MIFIYKHPLSKKKTLTVLVTNKLASQGLMWAAKKDAKDGPQNRNNSFSKEKTKQNKKECCCEL